MNPTPPARTHWRTVIVAALTIGLLWLFFRQFDFNRIPAAIANSHLGLLAAAIVVTMLTYFLRAWRWRVILRPIGPARLRTAFRTTVIGFTASFLLPARVGEILRPYLLARQEGLKAPATLATILVERLLDLVTVLTLFAASLPLSGLVIGPRIRLAGILAALGAVTALGVLFLCAGHPEKLARWTTRLTSRLPARIAERSGHVVHIFAEGLAVMRNPRQLLLSCMWSIPLWLSIAAGIWLTSLAFDLTFSYAASFLVVLFLTVGVAMPTPGGAGGFHAAYLFAVTEFFGADRNVAGAAAIVLHAVSFVPVTLLGLVFMWQDGLTLGGLKDMRKTAEAAELQ